jgi:putative SOS response-associated peptidase YedK
VIKKKGYNKLFLCGGMIMCGRFTLAAPVENIMEYFGINECIALKPRYNIAPSQDILTIRTNNNQQREFAIMRWGLIPKWQKEEYISAQWINARAETADEKPLFKDAFKHRRCLIVADGFYEWQQGKTKVPYYIHNNNGKLIAMAGLWESWKGKEGKIIESCTILTTEANTVVKSIHHRMPVILPQAAFDLWLSQQEQATEQLQQLLKTNQVVNLTSYAVSTLVNSPTNDNKECIEKTAENSI